MMSLGCMLNSSVVLIYLENILFQNSPCYVVDLSWPTSRQVVRCKKFLKLGF